MHATIEAFMDEVRARNSHEPEFLQAVQQKESVRLRRPASEGNPARDLEVETP